MNIFSLVLVTMLNSVSMLGRSLRSGFSRRKMALTVPVPASAWVPNRMSSPSKVSLPRETTLMMDFWPILTLAALLSGMLATAQTWRMSMMSMSSCEGSTGSPRWTWLSKTVPDALALTGMTGGGEPGWRDSTWRMVSPFSMRSPTTGGLEMTLPGMRDETTVRLAGMDWMRPMQKRVVWKVEMVGAVVLMPAFFSCMRSNRTVLGSISPC